MKFNCFFHIYCMLERFYIWLPINYINLQITQKKNIEIWNHNLINRMQENLTCTYLRYTISTSWFCNSWLFWLCVFFVLWIKISLCHWLHFTFANFFLRKNINSSLPWKSWLFSKKYIFLDPFSAYPCCKCWWLK
jgi:hypothetical protein